MRSKPIVLLALVVLCFAVSGAWAETVAGAGDIEHNNFYGITTLNLLVGGVAITFSGWLLGRRKTT